MFEVITDAISSSPSGMRRALIFIGTPGFVLPLLITLL
jgi:hypothetical protein